MEDLDYIQYHGSLSIKILNLKSLDTPLRTELALEMCGSHLGSMPGMWDVQSLESIIPLINDKLLQIVVDQWLPPLLLVPLSPALPAEPKKLKLANSESASAMPPGTATSLVKQKIGRSTKKSINV